VSVCTGEFGGIASKATLFTFRLAATHGINQSQVIIRVGLVRSTASPIFCEISPMIFCPDRNSRALHCILSICTAVPLIQTSLIALPSRSAMAEVHDAFTGNEYAQSVRMAVTAPDCVDERRERRCRSGDFFEGCVIGRRPGQPGGASPGAIGQCFVQDAF